MIDTVQKFFPWASNLPLPAKILLSVILVMIVALALIIIWTPHLTRTNGWPTSKTIDALSRHVRDLSETDRLLLHHVALTSRADGVYLSYLTEKTGLTRYEVQQRMLTLANDQLVEARDLTDKNYRIHGHVWTALGTQTELLPRLLEGATK